MKLLLDLNFLIVRYVIVDMEMGNPSTFEAVILQAPWWSVKTAMMRGPMLFNRYINAVKVRR